MQITLHTSAIYQTIGAYRSSVVPRTGELIRLAEAATASFKVTSICYPVRTTTDQESDLVELEIAPTNDAATQYIGEILYGVMFERNTNET